MPGLTAEVAAEAEEGSAEVEGRLAELAGGAKTQVDNIVRFLRGIPADDMAKKNELAKYFQTADGQRYTKKERKAAYDELLGAQRNRSTIG